MRPLRRFVVDAETRLILLDRLARRYGRPPSAWVLPPPTRSSDLVRAFDFDQMVFMVAVADDAREQQRQQHNAAVLEENNTRRRALGLPLDTLPG